MSEETQALVLKEKDEAISQLQGQVRRLMEALRISEQERKHFTKLSGGMFQERAALNRRNLPVDWREKARADEMYAELLAELRLVSAAFNVASDLVCDLNRDKDEKIEFHLALRKLIEVRTGQKIPLTDKDAIEEAQGGPVDNFFANKLGEAPKVPQKSYESMVKDGLKEPRTRL